MTANKPTTEDLMSALKTNKSGLILPRLKALGKAESCSRCGGCGEYSRCAMYGTTCFKCRGSGVQCPKLTKKFIDAVEFAVEAGGLDAYFTEIERKKEAKKLWAAAESGVKAAWESSKLNNWYEAELKKHGGGWSQFSKVQAEFPELFAMHHKAQTVYAQTWDTNRAAAKNPRIPYILDGKVWVKDAAHPKKGYYAEPDWSAITAEAEKIAAEIREIDAASGL